MPSYIALIHKDKDSDYGVSFPDFPGCITAGSTIEEAKDMAQEALQFHVQGMLEDDETLPEPSDMDAVMQDAVARKAVAFLVTIADKPAPPMRVNIMVPAADLKEIDAYAESLGLSRSGFLVQAAKKAMKKRAA